MSDLSSSLHPSQKGRSQNPSSLANIKTLVTLGMLTALAYAVMAVCKVIPAVGGFLSFDLKDTVMAIGGFLFGPAAALAMAIVVPFIELFTVSDTGWYGPDHEHYRHHPLCAPCGPDLPPQAQDLRRHSRSGGGRGLPDPGHDPLELHHHPLLFSNGAGAGGGHDAHDHRLQPGQGRVQRRPHHGDLSPVSAALLKTGLVAPSRNLPAGEKRKFNFVPTVISALVLLTGVLFLLALLGVI